ncbi:hypothetical protein KCP71_15515 [Salmonella enterica subsp. enterica]|nr:hypothetical protein KCP71_15515 [Salmonella enterica subsp. enterica]
MFESGTLGACWKRSLTSAPSSPAQVSDFQPFAFLILPMLYRVTRYSAGPTHP